MLFYFRQDLTKVVFKMKMNSEYLRRQNVELARLAIKKASYVTKNSLSQETGLSVASCNNILKDMLQKNEVIELSLDKPSGGRPARRFIYNPNFYYYATFYFRRENRQEFIHAVVYNAIDEETFENTFMFEELTIENLERILVALQQEYSKLFTLSISIPGVVNNGTIYDCDISSLKRFPLKQYIEDQFQITTILENDVNATAVGYYNNLIDDSSETFNYIYFPAKGLPGMGTIVNSNVLSGKSSFAGEIKHLFPDLTEKDLHNIQNNEDSFAQYVYRIIHSLTVTLNPKYIVYSGEIFTPSCIGKIKEQCRNSAIKEHIPYINYQEDIHDSLNAGLKFLAVEQLHKQLKGV